MEQDATQVVVKTAQGKTVFSFLMCIRYILLMLNENLKNITFLEMRNRLSLIHLVDF